MAQAQTDLRQQYVEEAAELYVEQCAVRHGAAGEGTGATPGRWTTTVCARPTHDMLLQDHRPGPLRHGHGRLA
ncbi:MAG: hypothetical protein R2854_24515 [Caldilineaceae bacterium]